MNNSILKNTDNNTEQDFWQELKDFTDARIALGRTGFSLPTNELLKFNLAHASAKDAVHLPFNREYLKQKLADLGLPVLYASSAAENRSEYLTRPDLGRILSAESIKLLNSVNPKTFDAVIAIGDGLSSLAVHKHAVPLIENLMPYITQLNISVAPIVLAEQARVALGDEIGQKLNADIVIMLIGERPGLSSPDSLGVYLTWKPRTGRLDSERNCISNIRPEGLSYHHASFRLAWLIENAFTLKLTGINLNDQSDNPENYKILMPIEFPDKAIE